MKAKSYKLKYVPTVQQLRDAGFLPGGAWIHAEAFMFAERRFAHKLSVSICFLPDLDVWDDFNNILVLDEEFGQPYTPFYSENYKKDTARNGGELPAKRRKLLRATGQKV